MESENKVAQSCLINLTPWTVVYQAPPSLEFSRQEYWSGLPFPSPGDLPDPGIEPGSPALQVDALPSVESVISWQLVSVLNCWSPSWYQKVGCWCWKRHYIFDAEKEKTQHFKWKLLFFS